jgi:hypothetical protein
LIRPCVAMKLNFLKIVQTSFMTETCSQS